MNGGEVTTMTAEDLQQRLEAGEDIAILDVREPQETASGMIRGAVPIPLGELGMRVGSLAAGRRYVCVCRSGARSEAACHILGRYGLDAVNLEGGMLGWPGETLA